MNRICGYPLRITCIFDGSKYEWDVINESHNHEPSSEMSGHARAQKLTEDQKRKVINLRNANVKPSQIAISLKQEQRSLALSRDLINCVALSKLKELNGANPATALMNILDNNNLEYDIERNEEGAVTNIFYTFPASIRLAKDNLIQPTKPIDSRCLCLKSSL